MGKYPPAKKQVSSRKKVRKPPKKKDVDRCGYCGGPVAKQEWKPHGTLHTYVIVRRGDELSGAKFCSLEDLMKKLAKVSNHLEVASEAFTLELGKLCVHTVLVKEKRNKKKHIQKSTKTYDVPVT